MAPLFIFDAKIKPDCFISARHNVNLHALFANVIVVMEHEDTMALNFNISWVIKNKINSK